MNNNFSITGDLPIVEIHGDLYWDSDEEPPHGYEYEEVEVEVNDVPAFRRVVGMGNVSRNQYTLEGDNYWFASFDSDDAILADRRDKRVYKDVTKCMTDEMESEYFVVFKNENSKWYCIRNGCQDCEHSSVCTPTPEIVDILDNQPMIISSLDVSAQEPTHITLLSGESEYYPTFRNRTIRELKLDKYVHHVVSKYFHFNPDKYSDKSKGYWTWLHQFHWNPTRLLEYNKLVDDYRGGDNTVKDRLDEMTKTFLSEIENILNQIGDK